MLELQGESGDENEVQAPIRRKKVKVSCANTYLHTTYLCFLCTYVLKTKAKSLPSNGLSFSECSSIMHMHPANVARDMYQRPAAQRLRMDFNEKVRLEAKDFIKGLSLFTLICEY